MVMPGNVVQNPRYSLGLDTWVLMENALRLGKRPIYNWSFNLNAGSIVLCEANKKSPKAGKLVLGMNWPKEGQNYPTGFVTVSHPDWKTLPRFVLVAGIPNKDGGLLWRFLCPITRKLVQVVYFDEKSRLFVSRSALGRQQRRSDFSRIVRDVVQILKLEHKCGDLTEKPARMSDLAFDMLKEERDALYHEFHLAASGVPEPILNEDGWYNVVAMSKRPARKDFDKGRIYYRDKSGALKMNAKSKRRLGMS
jgi:hypothetical protein